MPPAYYSVLLFCSLQIACQRVFQYTHGNKVPENVGNHPNAYFDASIKYYRDLEGG